MDEEFIIPTNVSSGFEMLDGIGVKEIINILIAAACGAGIMLIVRMIVVMPMHYAVVGFIVTPSAFAYFLTKRGPYGPSALSVISAVIKYLKEQKRYLYIIKQSS